MSKPRSGICAAPGWCPDLRSIRRSGPGVQRTGRAPTTKEPLAITALVPEDRAARGPLARARFNPVRCLTVQTDEYGTMGRLTPPRRRHRPARR